MARPPTPDELPIQRVREEIRAAVRDANRLVVVAPTGSGKSTQLPKFLLDSAGIEGDIVVLEPRRLAARTLAMRVAHELGDECGGIVGYETRHDRRVSDRTRIRFVTDGLFVRQMQRDPTLARTGAVILDEFHERSVAVDVALGLVKLAQESRRRELRMIVTSATLEAQRLEGFLGCRTVVAEGRSYPVTIEHLARPSRETPWDLAGAAIERVLDAFATGRADDPGHILVFMPGAYEIMKTCEKARIALARTGVQADVLPLHGALPPDEQDRAVSAVDPAKRRRIIVSTNVAETSLTIDGVRTVIDSGLARIHRYDPLRGLDTLRVEPISRASAEQRAGRAGRVAAGNCYRLWSEGSQRSLAAFSRAEILDADLTPLALDLAEWGATTERGLRWLDAPPAATLDGARDLLRRLGALDALGRLTSHGRTLVRLPAHPRLAHLLVEASARGVASLGAKLAALLAERDLLRGRGANDDVDVLTRLDVLEGGRARGEVDRGAVERARRMVTQFERMLGDRTFSTSRATQPELDVAGLLACAYPDRIGKRREGGEGRFLLTNGRGARFARPDRLAKQDFIVAIDLDDRDREAQIQLATAIDRETLIAAAGERLQRTDEVAWSTRDQCVLARRLIKLDALILEERPLTEADSTAMLGAMLQGVREMGLDCLPWDETTRTLCARAELARRVALPGTEAWPSFAAAALLEALEDWLSPWLDGVTRRSHLQRVPLHDALNHRLDSTARSRLDEWLPTHIVVPTGSKIRVDYLSERAPAAAMRMQEVFGLAATPKLALGKLPVTFELLSPAQRPLQVTADLESFWRNAYADVRKDMRGRYPRHYWPENPLEAEPTRGVRRRT